MLSNLSLSDRQNFLQICRYSLQRCSLNLVEILRLVERRLDQRCIVFSGLTRKFRSRINRNECIYFLLFYRITIILSCTREKISYKYSRVFVHVLQTTRSDTDLQMQIERCRLSLRDWRARARVRADPSENFSVEFAWPFPSL